MSKSVFDRRNATIVASCEIWEDGDLFGIFVLYRDSKGNYFRVQADKKETVIVPMSKSVAYVWVERCAEEVYETITL